MRAAALAGLLLAVLAGSARAAALEGVLRLMANERGGGTQAAFVKPDGAPAVYARLPEPWQDSWRTGARVSLSGSVAADGSFTADSVSVLSAAPAAAAPLAALSASPADGVIHRRIYVIDTVFTDWASGLSQGDLRQQFFDGDSSMAAYFKKLSNGKLDVTGTVFSNVRLGIPFPPLIQQGYYSWCDLDTILKAVDAQGLPIPADSDGLSSFWLITPCGEGMIGGGVAASPGANAHEYGHNLGLFHANTLVCQDDQNRPLVISKNLACDRHSQGCTSWCGSQEYGDHFELMGTGGGLDAYHRLKLGWMPAENSVSVSADGAYTLADVNSGASQTQVLRIAKGLWMDYYVEYRAPQPGDAGMIQGGVQVRLADSYGRFNYSSDTQLLHAQSPIQQLPSVAAGSSFVDPYLSGGLVVTVLSTSAASASVYVHFGSTTPAVLPPVLSALSVSLPSPSQAVVSWTTDRAADGALDYGPTAAYGATAAQPGGASTAHSVSLSGLAPGTKYLFRARSSAATGTAALEGSFTTPALPVNCPAPPAPPALGPVDTSLGAARWTPPALTARQGLYVGAVKAEVDAGCPAGSSCVLKRETTGAAPAAGVFPAAAGTHYYARAAVLADGACPAQSAAAEWTMPRLAALDWDASAGTHSLTVKAYDASGKTAEQIVTVVVAGPAEELSPVLVSPTDGAQAQGGVAVGAQACQGAARLELFDGEVRLGAMGASAVGAAAQ